MRQPFLILTLSIFMVLSHNQCFAKDSTQNLSFCLGYNFYGINNEIYADKGAYLLNFYNGKANFKHFSTGLKTSLPLSPIKQVDIAAMYSKSSITYFMKYDNPGTQISFEREGLIKFNTIGLNANIDNKVYKFFSLHYGLNLTYIIKNQFDVDSVARRISWYDTNGNSNLKCNPPQN